MTTKLQSKSYNLQIRALLFYHWQSHTRTNFRFNNDKSGFETLENAYFQNGSRPSFRIKPRVFQKKQKPAASSYLLVALPRFIRSIATGQALHGYSVYKFGNAIWSNVCLQTSLHVRLYPNEATRDHRSTLFKNPLHMRH